MGNLISFFSPTLLSSFFAFFQGLGDDNPTPMPVLMPTLGPTMSPTLNPTGNPTGNPTNLPPGETASPTLNPTMPPTSEPTSDPTGNPTRDPTSNPTGNPTRDPTSNPTGNPTTGGGDPAPVEKQIGGCTTNDSSKFNLCLDIRVSPASETFYQQAFTLWESVNSGDVGPAGGDSFQISADQLTDRNTFVNLEPTFVDDLYIGVEEVIDDGVGGILGFAGPTSTSAEGRPITGMAKLDKEDVENFLTQNTDASRAVLLNAITHELGHCHGIGTAWVSQNLVNQVAKTYTGANANAVWKAGCPAGGDDIPIEPDFGHWDEDCLGDELMTPTLFQGRPNPLSTVTVNGLKDLKWNISQADIDRAQPFVFADQANVNCTRTCVNPARSLRQGGTQDENVQMTRRKQRKLSDEMINKAAEGAHALMAKMRADAPTDLPDGITYVGGDVLTAFMLDDDGKVRDYTFQWDDVKDRF